MPVSSMAMATDCLEAFGAHRDAPAFGREFHCIGQQVENDLLEPAAVGVDDDVLGDLGREHQLLVLRARSNNAYGFR